MSNVSRPPSTGRSGPDNVLDSENGDKNSSIGDKDKGDEDGEVNARGRKWRQKL